MIELDSGETLEYNTEDKETAFIMLEVTAMWHLTV